MKQQIVLITSLIIGSALGFTTQAAPTQDVQSVTKSNNGNGVTHNPSPEAVPTADHANRHDDRGRNEDYFDNHRDAQGHHRGRDTFGNLAYGDITQALAREYAYDDGFRGYTVLAPAVRQHLNRGDPWPAGLDKKAVPGQLLDRLPRHPGYAWYIAGTDLILVAMDTGVIADVFYDVFE